MADRMLQPLLHAQLWGCSYSSCLGFFHAPRVPLLLPTSSQQLELLVTMQNSAVARIAQSSLALSAAQLVTR